jgi:hypothetical protein
MTDETTALALLPQNGSIVIRTRGVELELPELVARSGARAAEASFEFFTARIPNEHTRDAIVAHSSGSPRGARPGPLPFASTPSRRPRSRRISASSKRRA